MAAPGAGDRGRPGGVDSADVEDAQIKTWVKQAADAGHTEPLDRLAQAVQDRDPEGIREAGRRAKAFLDRQSQAEQQQAVDEDFAAIYAHLKDPAQQASARMTVTGKVPQVVRFPSEREQAPKGDLKAIVARAQARSEADRTLRAAREAHDKRTDRYQEFLRYEAAGRPNGDLTPEEKRELAELEQYMKTDRREKIRQAEAAHREGNYEQVHRILRG